MSRDKSPLRYAGGKSRALPYIAAHLPKQIDEYREPFLGGGSVALMISERFSEASIWVNDAFLPLVAFWRTVASPDACDKMISRLVVVRSQMKSELKARKKFHDLKATMLDPETDELSRAVAYYVFNKCAFSGTQTANFSRLCWKRWIHSERQTRELARWTPLVGRWKITCGDYEPVLTAPWTGKAGFVFADPPYDIEASLYFYHRAFDHGRFRRVAADIDANCMVTYNSNVYGDFAQWPTRRIWEMRYSMGPLNSDRSERKKKNELLALNYSHRRSRPSVPSPKPALVDAGDDMRVRLEALGISQLEFARQFGVAGRTVRYWLAGERRPHPAALRELTRMEQQAARRRSVPAPA